MQLLLPLSWKKKEKKKNNMKVVISPQCWVMYFEQLQHIRLATQIFRRLHTFASTSNCRLNSQEVQYNESTQCVKFTLCPNAQFLYLSTLMLNVGIWKCCERNCFFLIISYTLNDIIRLHQVII